MQNHVCVCLCIVCLYIYCIYIYLQVLCINIFCKTKRNKNGALQGVVAALFSSPTKTSTSRHQKRTNHGYRGMAGIVVSELCYSCLVWFRCWHDTTRHGRFRKDGFFLLRMFFFWCGFYDFWKICHNKLFLCVVSFFFLNENPQKTSTSQPNWPTDSDSINT